MLNLIKELDQFGFTPHFFVSGKKKFQSKFGGSIFILFVIFCLYYSWIQCIAFIKNQTEVYSSRNLILDSESFNLTNSEF